jgi:hypothetical protein
MIRSHVVQRHAQVEAHDIAHVVEVLLEERLIDTEARVIRGNNLFEVFRREATHARELGEPFTDRVARRESWDKKHDRRRRPDH